MPKILTIIVLPLLLMITALCSYAASPPAAVTFAARSVTTNNGTYSYRVFIPAHWNGRRKCAVILFLHGAGERGDDNVSQTKNGIRLLIGQNADQFPAVVVCPQCRDKVRWTQPEMEEMALKALDASIKEFNGDPSRVYLTGLSLGGYGTWDLAQRYPARWAAIAPCCGGIIFPRQPTDPPLVIDPNADPYRSAAEKVVPLPTWIFHGGSDPVVPVSESRQMAALLFSMKADVRYTEYPNVGHNSWDNAYQEPGLLSWFLSHKSSSH